MAVATVALDLRAVSTASEWEAFDEWEACDRGEGGLPPRDYILQDCIRRGHTRLLLALPPVLVEERLKVHAMAQIAAEPAEQDSGDDSSRKRRVSVE